MQNMHFVAVLIRQVVMRLPVKFVTGTTMQLLVALSFIFEWCRRICWV